MLKIGDKINVIVTKYDPSNKRVSLGIKQLTEDPWKDIEKKYIIGNEIKATISNIADYGAFVELQKGVEGLIHVSEMSWTKKNVHPNTILKINDEVNVKILEVDLEKRRISLGLKQCLENPWVKFKENYDVDQIISGKIKNLTEFGIFIELPDELDGMVHLSDIDWDETGQEAIKKYSKNQEVKAKILDIDVEKERIGLGIKQLNPNKKSNKEIGKVVTCIIKKAEDNRIIVSLEKDKEGFIKKQNIAKLKSDQKTDRFAIDEKIDAKIINYDKAKKIYELSIKELEILEEKKVLEQYGSSSSGASLGDILGAEMEDKVKKIKDVKTADKDEKK